MGNGRSCSKVTGEKAKLDLEPRIIAIPKITEARGNLGFVEGNRHIPFSIERVYFLNDVPGGTHRGSHAHKKLEQFLIPLSGSFTVVLNDGEKSVDFVLDRSHQGLFLPPGYWRTLKDFTSGAVVVVLASQPYDPDDYINNYDEFIAWKKLRSASRDLKSVQPG
jgi:dTDP-4-dehydrorhamnose 3,5-epimerase-like enzyme